MKFKFLIRQAFFLMIYVCLYTKSLASDEFLEFRKENSSAWPVFKYPANLIMDKRSFKEEGYYWSVKYNSPNGELSLTVNAHGFVPELYEHEYGFSDPRDVVLVYELKSAKRLKRNRYEIFIEEGKGYTKAIFYKNDSEWGKCYNQLYVTYPKGKSQLYKPTIQKVIDSFVPWFLVKKK